MNIRIRTISRVSKVLSNHISFYSGKRVILLRDIHRLTEVACLILINNPLERSSYRREKNFIGSVRKSTIDSRCNSCTDSRRCITTEYEFRVVIIGTINLLKSGCSSSIDQRIGIYNCLRIRDCSTVITHVQIYARTESQRKVLRDTDVTFCALSRQNLNSLSQSIQNVLITFCLRVTRSRREGLIPFHEHYTQILR